MQPSFASEVAPLSGEAIQIDLLFEAIFIKYRYDFRRYTRPVLVRRIRQFMLLSGLKNVSEMQKRILTDSAYFGSLLLALTVNFTTMFRDPVFYRQLRVSVLPELARLDHVKIWSAGCSSGEELYSIGICVDEVGLHNRSIIYGTDIDQEMLLKAKLGIYPLARMQEYSRNYQESGGVGNPVSYFSSDNHAVVARDHLKDNVKISIHDLVTDPAFGTMDLILCRNVLIYFTKELQDKVFTLFADSLRTGGYLCLGAGESALFNSCSGCFREISEAAKIYQKVD